MGEVTLFLLLTEDNNRKWSGDHLIDHSLIADTIFVNKKIELKEPSILDIAPTLLDLFKISKTQDMKGKILFRDEDK